MSYTQDTHNSPRIDHRNLPRPVLEHGSPKSASMIHTRTTERHETRHNDLDASMLTHGLTAQGLTHKAEKLQDHTFENDMSRIRVKITPNMKGGLQKITSL